MATRTKNPLEPGVYRVDFRPELAPVFGRWRRAQQGKVHVLELEGVGENARVSFVVFGKPGAFPFGQLGYPEQGQIVGALPDWVDVVAFIANPVAAVEAFLVSHAMAWARDATRPELEPLRAAVQIAKLNIAIVTANLESIRAGKAPNPGALLQASLGLVEQSIELLLAKAGGLAVAFPRDAINELLAKLHALKEAIKSAPGKALHSVTQFGKGLFTDVVAPFVLPFDVGMAGLTLAAGGAVLGWLEGKVTPTSKNLMLAGGAIALLGTGVLGHNLATAFSHPGASK